MFFVKRLAYTKIRSIFAAFRIVGRVVECGSLENYCTARYRGFESLTVRKKG
jgi:hypothetical protein